MGIKSISELKVNDLSYVLKWGNATHLGALKEEYCEEI